MWKNEIENGTEIVPQAKGKFNPRANSRIVQNGDFAYVELTKGEWSRIDVSNVHLVAGKAWHVMIDKTGVKYARGCGGSVRMHKILCPVCEGMQVDHVNGNVLDNVASNLRAVTPGQNQMNKSRQSNSKYGTGVHLDKRYGTFTALIKANGKQKYLGSYSTPEEAKEAYRRASLAEFGNFSYHARANAIEKGTG